MLKGNRLRASYAERIDELSLPYRFTTRELRDAIAALRGKPIMLRPMDTLGVGKAPCGVRLETPHADLIFYEESASVHHQRHILTHELMHVYLDHPGSLELDASTAHAVGVNRTLVLRMSGRTSYSSADEREAEMLASVVRHRMYQEREAPAPKPGKGIDGWEALFAQPATKGRRRWS